MSRLPSLKHIHIINSNSRLPSRILYSLNKIYNSNDYPKWVRGKYTKFYYIIHHVLYLDLNRYQSRILFNYLKSHIRTIKQLKIVACNLLRYCKYRGTYTKLNNEMICPIFKGEDKYYDTNSNNTVIKNKSILMWRFVEHCLEMKLFNI